MTERWRAWAAWYAGLMVGGLSVSLDVGLLHKPCWWGLAWLTGTVLFMAGSRWVVERSES